MSQLSAKSAVRDDNDENKIKVEIRYDDVDKIENFFNL